FLNTFTPRRPQRLSFLLALVSATLSFTANAAPAPGSTTSTRPYVAPAKPTRTVLGKHDSREFVEVKFAQGQTVRLRNGHLNSTALSKASVTQLENVLSQHVVARIEPLFHAANESELQ